MCGSLYKLYKAPIKDSNKYNASKPNKKSVFSSDFIEYWSYSEDRKNIPWEYNYSKGLLTFDKKRSNVLCIYIRL